MTHQFSPLVNSPREEGSNTSRFSQAAWFRFVQSQDLMVAGAGGIGSWLAFMISRLNPHSITLVDDDVVDATNMAGQFFSRNDIGSLKIEAVRRLIEQFSNFTHLSLFDERVTESWNTLQRVVFCGFDNMSARRIMYNIWKRRATDPSNDGSKFLFIDGRLSAETLQVFCIPGNAPYYMEEYESKWLFNDSEAESTICSYKQTSYCANLIASIMTNLFVNWCTNHCDPLIERSLPFFTEYAAEQMYLKTEA